MLCTMCMRGTTKQWRCRCGETNCRHMLSCSKCSENRYKQEKDCGKSLAVNASARK